MSEGGGGANITSTLTNLILVANAGNSSFVVTNDEVPSLFVDSASKVGINTLSPSAQLEINSDNGACIALRYGNSDTAYANIGISNAGDVAISPNGTKVSISRSLDLTNHNGSTTGLKLGGSLVQATASDMNRLAGVTAGSASAGKILILDNNKSITGISSISSSAISGTLQTAAQPNITSIGTLSTLSVSGALSASTLMGTLQTADQSNITSVGTLGSLTVSGGVSASTVTGTLQTAAQPNITSVGDLTSLTVAGVTLGTGLAALSEVTAGTAEALKAMIPDDENSIGGLASISATDITGTLQTALQPHITSVGTLTSLSVTNGVSASTLTGTLQTAAQPNITSVGALSTVSIAGTTVGSEIARIVGVTAGAATASKAIIVDVNKSVSGLNALSATTLTGTLQTAAQPNVTSIGSLSSLTVAGHTVSSEVAYLENVTAGTADASKAVVLNSSGAVTGISSLSATNLTGTLQTGAQTNITSVGTLSALTVSGSTNLTSTTNSTSTTTGAIKVAGGIGVARDMFVGGTIDAQGFMLNGEPLNTGVMPSYLTDITAGTAAAGKALVLNGSSEISGISSLSSTSLTGTLQTAAQTNITSVGTLSSLTVSGGITGTLQTGAQTNITSVGTLTGLTSSGVVSVTSITNSTSTTTGAVKVSGGMGVAFDMFVGGTIDAQAFTVGGQPLNISSISSTATNTLTLTNSSSSGCANILYANDSGNSWSVGSRGSAAGAPTNGFYFSNGTIRMVINSSGNVGIGTTAPTSPLTVNGSISCNELIVDGFSIINNFRNMTNLVSLASGTISVTNVTDATSTTTGVLTVPGGVGIAKTLYVGIGIYGTLQTAAQTNITSVGTLTSLTSSGAISVTNATDASSDSTGALIISGGVGVAKTLYVGTGIYGTLQTATQTSITSVGTLTSLTSSGAVSITNTTGSSSVSTGALIVSGGVGIAKTLYVGTGIYGTLQTAAQTNITSVGTLSSLTVTNDVSASTLTGTLQTAAQTNITSVGTLGSLTVTNGITASTLTGTLQTASQTNITSVGTLGSLTVSGTIHSTATIDSSSVSTGSLIVDGGIGIAKKLYVGTGIYGTLQTAAQANITSVGTLTGLTSSGAVSITDTTTSSSSTTGALIISGGVGIAGNLNIGSSSKITSPQIVATSYIQVGTSTDTARLISALKGSLGNGGTTYLTLGKANSNNNQAELSYYHAEDNNTSNQFRIGGYGVGPIVYVQFDGKVGFGVSSPSYTVDVSGDINLSGSIRVGGVAQSFITSTQSGYLNIAAIGTAEASKALILDANKDITSIRNLTATNLTGTLQTAAQPNVTSVGTLSSLAVTNGITASTLTGAIQTASQTNITSVGTLGSLTVTNGVTANTLTGTLQTAAQTNITSVGTLGSLSVTNGITASTLTGTLQTAAQANITSVGTLTSLTSSGAVSITNATDASSYSTGALIVSGGVGIAKNLYVNSGIYGTLQTAAQTNITSVGTLGSLTVTNGITASTLTGTLQTAAQTGITSVGTLSALSVTGAVTAGSLTLGSTAISETEIAVIDGVTAGTATASKALVVDANKDIASIRNLTATNLTGTLQTAAQTNITSVGTLSSLAVTNGVTASTLTGTLQTGAQTNITSVGTLGSLTVTNGITASMLTGTLQTAIQTNITSVGTLGSLTVTNGITASQLTGTLQTADQANVTSVGTLTALTVSGATHSTNTTDSSSYSTGALIVDGGVGIAKKLYVNNGIYGTIQTAAQANITSVGTLGSLAVTNGITASTLTGTLQTAAQPNITSVGTLSSLTVTNGVTASTLTGTLQTGAQTNITSVGTLGSLSVTNGITASTLTGTLQTAAQTNVTSVGTLTGLTSSGVISITNTTDSSSVSTGALLVSGGVGIAKTLYVGTGIYGTLQTAAQTNITSVGTLSSLTVTNGVTASTFTGAIQTAAQTNITSVGTLTGLTVSGSTSYTSTTDSSSTTTGALVISGGVGIAKTLYVGTGIYGTLQTAAQTNITSVGTLSSLTVTNGVSASTLTGTLQTASQPNVTSVGTLSSLAVTNGVTASTLTGTLQTASQPNVTSVGTLTSLTSSGAVSLTNTTDASSAANGGALTISGGLGVAKNVYIGGSLTVSGTTTTVNSSMISIADNTLVLNASPTGPTDSGMLINRYQTSNNTGLGSVITDTPNATTTVSSATTLTVVLASGSSTDNYYNGWWLQTGTQARQVSSYVGSTKTITISSAFNSTPSNGASIQLFNRTYAAMIWDETYKRFQCAFTANDATTLSIIDDAPLRVGALTTSDIATITSTTDSTSTSTGSLITSGGVGIAKTLYVGTGIYGTLQTAAQTNITSVGTLSSLAVTNGITASTLTGTLQTGAQTNITSVGTLGSLTVTNGITASTLTGTLQTAAQTNITSVGTLTGLTSSGAISITSTTDSSSTSTGALIVSGGVGIAKTLYVGTGIYGTLQTAAQTNITSVGTLSSLAVTNGITASTLTGTLQTAAQTNVTSVGTLTGLTSSGAVSITSTAASTSSTTGALIVSGGVGIGGKLYTGPSVASANNAITITNTNSAGIANMLFCNDSGSNWEVGSRGSTSAAYPNGFYIYNGGWRFVIQSDGKVGVGVTPNYKLDVNGDFNCTAIYVGTTQIVDTSRNITNIGSLTASTITGTLQTAAQTNITSVGTLGSLTVTNGITASTLTGTLQTAAQTNITSVGTLTDLTSSGAISFTSTTDSSSNITGALIVSGGVGIAKKLYVGTGIYGTLQTAAQANITSVGTLTGLTSSGAISITSTTDSSSNSTGALIVSGGVGIAKTLYVGTGIYGTLQTAAQTNITSVGTLSSLTVTNGITASTFTGTLQTADQTNITSVGTLSSLTVTNGITASTFTGTLQTAAQANITSVGTLTGLTSSGAVSITNATASTSSTTGALIISGGVGIAGNLNIGTGSKITSPQIVATSSLQVGTSTDTTRMISCLDSTVANTNIRYITLGKANTTNNQAELSYYHTGDGSASNQFRIGRNGGIMMYVQFDGKVGVGVSSPSYALDVSGDINMTGSLRINGVTQSSITSTQAGYLSVTPGTASASKALVLAADSSISGVGQVFVSTTNNTGISITNTSSSGDASLVLNNDSGSPWKVASSGSAETGGYANAFTIGNGTARLRITPDGKVGIGAQTPSCALDVAGQVNIASTVNNMITLTNTSSSGLSNILYCNDSGANWEVGSRGSASTAPLNGFYFYNGNFRMVIQSDGKVGIGTQTPSQLLDVAGNMHVANTLMLGNSTDTSRMISALNSGLGSGSAVYFTLGKANASNQQAEISFVYNSPGNSYLGLGCYGGTSVYISSNGAAGFGAENTSNNCRVYIGNALNSQTLSYNPGYMVNNTGPGAMSPTITGVNLSLETNQSILCHVAVYITSDRRIKQNISPISNDDAMRFVNNVTPVKYEKKNTPDKQELGYIAQDLLKEDFKQLVNVMANVDMHATEAGDVEGGELSVDYSRVCALLHTAMKQIMSRLDKLENPQ